MIENISILDIVDKLSIAAILIDNSHNILWYNDRFTSFFSKYHESFVGRKFYEVIDPVFIDGEYAPTQMSRKTNGVKRSIISPRSNLERRFELTVTPVDSSTFVIEMKDVSESYVTEQKFEILQSSSAKLTTTSDSYLNLSPQAQKEELKKAIQEDMKQTLNQDVVEIRLLDPKTNALVPFINFGLNEQVAQKKLFAKSNGNGITGYVASSGEPYICNDTKNDAHYEQGAIDARSSLTVPLFFMNNVIGVFNVESNKPHAFSKRDMAFLQLYVKDVALAVHLHHSIASTIEKIKRSSFNSIESFLEESVSKGLEASVSVKKLLETQSFTPKLREIVNKYLLDVQNIFYSLAAPVKTFRPSVSNPDANLSPKSQNSIQSIEDELEILQSKEVANFLKGCHVLVVSNESQDFVRELRKYGCLVIVVRSTATALEALQNPNYSFDLVITSRFPDGTLLDFDGPISEHNSLNRYQESLMDIHKPHYFVPAEGDEFDKQVRLQVHNKIVNEGKLDAYFFKKKLHELNLEKYPIMLVEIGEPITYDPTHNIPPMIEIDGRQQQSFLSGRSEVVKLLLMALQKALTNQ